MNCSQLSGSDLARYVGSYLLFTRIGAFGGVHSVNAIQPNTKTILARDRKTAKKKYLYETTALQASFDKTRLEMV